MNEKVRTLIAELTNTLKEQSENDVAKENYFMDAENQALDTWKQFDVVAKGWKRAFDKEWVMWVSKYLDLCGNDGFYSEEEWKTVKINEYREWVKKGGGDVWFGEKQRQPTIPVEIPAEIPAEISAENPTEIPETIPETIPAEIPVPSCDVCQRKLREGETLKVHITCNEHVIHFRKDGQYHCEKCKYQTKDCANFGKHLLTKKHQEK